MSDADFQIGLQMTEKGSKSDDNTGCGENL